MVPVEHDGFGGERALHRLRRLEHNEPEVGDLQGQQGERLEGAKDFLILSIIFVFKHGFVGGWFDSRRLGPCRPWSPGPPCPASG